MNCLGELDSFLRNYVFGSGYCKVIPNSEKDDWVLFLKERGIISIRKVMVGNYWKTLASSELKYIRKKYK